MSEKRLFMPVSAMDKISFVAFILASSSAVCRLGLATGAGAGDAGGAPDITDMTSATFSWGLYAVEARWGSPAVTLRRVEASDLEYHAVSSLILASASARTLLRLAMDASDTMRRMRLGAFGSKFAGMSDAVLDVPSVRREFLAARNELDTDPREAPPSSKAVTGRGAGRG